MAITASGIGSGLDVDSLVGQLVASERAPADSRLNRSEALLQAKLSAFGSLKSALSTFQSSLSSLLNLTTFQARTATVSDAKILTVSAGTEAAAGSYNIEVSQLARAHSLASGVYSATTAVVGAGELTFRFGTTDYDVDTDTYSGFAVNAAKTEAKVTIDSTNNTLAGIRDAINAANVGVSATIVNDGVGFRLLLSSGDTGAKNSLEVSVTESGAAGLGQLAFNATATNLTQTVAAQDAQLTINGLSVSSASNTVSSAIADVNLTLLSTTAGAPVSVGVAQDKATVKNAINGFVTSYNSFISTVNSISGYNADTQQGGILLGDATLRSITSRVRSELNAAIGGSATLQRLADIGVTTAVDGKLSVDSAALDKVLSDNFNALAGLFTANATASDALVKYVSSTTKSQPGTYPVAITQVATQGQYQGVGVLPDFSLTSVVIDSLNDTLSLKVDGVQAGTITLTAGTYTSGNDLAAEVEARINADGALSSAGATVKVTYDSANSRLVVNSGAYGADSKVEITQVDTSTAATLGFAIGAGTDGLDVVGAIGGITATGVGRTLTGAAGSASEGLVLEVIGGGTGARGSVSVNRGVAGNLNAVLDQYLGTQNLLDLRTENLTDQIKDISEQRENLNLRMESVETRYLTRFRALDILLAQLQQTSGFLTQQLQNLPGAISPNQK